MKYHSTVCFLLSTIYIIASSFRFSPSIICLNRNRNRLVENIMNEITCTPLYSIMEKNYNRRAYDESEDGLALDDFKQLLEGVATFKDLFGDLKIPTKFDVPAQDPWNPAIHGLRLGKRLEKLFSSSEFMEKHPDKVREFVKLGLEPSVTSLADEWTVIYDAVKIYKEVHGDLRISAKFVIPDEDPWPRLTRQMKLGVRVAAIRSAGRYVKEYPERKAQLDELGFEWRIRDNTHRQQVGQDLFDQVYEALKIYKQHVNADLMVPADFEVPEEEINTNSDSNNNKSVWPEELRGLKLGAYVQGIREDNKMVFGHNERVEMLRDIGFAWEEPASRSVYSQKRFDLIYSALLQYKNWFGNILVPQNYVVPSEAPWSEDTWGLKLGARTNAIRSQGTFVNNSPERRERLNSIGFTWEMPSEAKRRKKLLLSAEGDNEEEAKSSDNNNSKKTGKGRDLLDNNILGPRSNPFITTGTDTSGIDSDHQQQQQQQQDDGEGEGDEDINSTLSLTKKIRSASSPGRRIAGVAKSVLSYDPSLLFEPVGYREIAAEAMKDFLVDRELSDDPDIRMVSHFEGHLQPEQFNQVITRTVSEEDIEAMKRVGYRILEFGRFNWNTVMEAMHIYKHNYGDLLVPKNFTVDEKVIYDNNNNNENNGFDERFEDLRLGEIVEGLRTGDIDGLEDPIRRSELDAIGFEWGDLSRHQRFRFVPMLLGLKIFKHLYGIPMPQTDFVVPDAPQWPYWMAGMPLGEWTAVVRIQQQMVEEHYPHRRDMLNALEFLWWVPPSERISPKYYSPVQ